MRVGGGGIALGVGGCRGGLVGLEVEGSGEKRLWW